MQTRALPTQPPSVQYLLKDPDKNDFRRTDVISDTPVRCSFSSLLPATEEPHFPVNLISFRRPLTSRLVVFSGPALSPENSQFDRPGTSTTHMAVKRQALGAGLLRCAPFSHSFDQGPILRFVERYLATIYTCSVAPSIVFFGGLNLGNVLF